MTTTRALLLTDVVDSTKLAEQLGDARMAEIWVAHDRALRDQLATWRGLEIDRTDGFLMLFEQVADAVGFGAAVHAELARVGERFGVPFTARVGVHWGPVILIETSVADRALGAKPLEVEGLAKPLAARVMSLASGGQTLLTSDAREQLEPGVPTVSHGAWRMKGVTEPVELFEVATPSAPLAPPPDSAKVYRVVRSGDLWLPVRDVRHNVPVERDAFFGREQNLRTLAKHLDDGARLVSVLGIGGTGKTRLVTRFAWTWLGDYPGGAWFCDLSEARSVEGIASAVATALDIPLGKDDPITQLGHAIAGRGACLVVLDNFEQVARHAGATVGKWLDRASEARFVVTSREVLGLPGEQALALPPLRREEAVALFVARAGQAKQDFALTTADRPHVEALVDLLDGLPLAIELAAARVRVMPPKTLLQRMSERFRLLSSSGGRHTRQATLRATLDWSWDLLSPDEQEALAQLSVFEGGFTLDAAEGVLSLGDLWPTDAVQALVDKSLVRRATDERFDLLVSVQEYAAEKLTDRGAAEARHGTWFATLGTDEALDALATHGGQERRRALMAELDNLVAACRRAVARGDGTVAVPALLAAAWVLDLKGPSAIGAELSQAVLGLALEPSARARAAQSLAGALRILGRADQARANLEQALAIYGEVGDRRSEGAVLRSLGVLHAEQARMEQARERYEQALAVLCEVGDHRLEGAVHSSLGILHRGQGRRKEAHEHVEQALALHRKVGDRRLEATTLCTLGDLHHTQGRVEEARVVYEQALGASREVGDRRLEGGALCGLGILHSEQGRIEEARAHYDQARAAYRDTGDRRLEATMLGNIGILHHGQGRLEEASTRYEQALAVLREVGARRLEGGVLGNLGLLRHDQGRTQEARAIFEQALAALQEVGDRRFEGLVLCNLGALLVELGQGTEARAILERALAVLREVGDRRVEGAALGALANLALAEGLVEEARAALALGERHLREMGDASELGQLLCVKVRLLVRCGDAAAARQALEEAETLAVQVSAGPSSGLAGDLAGARRALEPPAPSA